MGVFRLYMIIVYSLVHSIFLLLYVILDRHIETTLTWMDEALVPAVLV